MTQGVVSPMLCYHPVLVCLLRSLDLLSAKGFFFYCVVVKARVHVSLISEIYFCLPCVFPLDVFIGATECLLDYLNTYARVVGLLWVAHK